MNTETIQILLIEDDPGDAVLVGRMLAECRQLFELQHRECLKDALAALDDCIFDVILLDLSLADSFGLTALEKLSAVAPDIPIVVLTGLSDEDLALQALECGAQEYLSKCNATAELLQRGIRYAIQRQQIQTENRQLLEAMEQLARRDTLTGVMNRLSFTESLEDEWKRSKRYGSPLSCVVLDLDFFKRINDAFGHAAGDRVLIEVATTLQTICRTTDRVGRLGGEEFCVLMPEIDESEAVKLAERFRQEIAGLVISVDDTDLQVTVSLGVSGIRPEMNNAQSLINCADEAMFVAKQNGRDQVVAFHSICSSDQKNDLRIWQGITAQNLMNRLDVSFAPDQCALEAICTLAEQQVDSLPVIDKDGTLVGVVDEDDIMAAMLVSNVTDLSVSDVMKTQVVTFSMESEGREVCEFLSRSSVRQVFVCDGNQPIGIIRRINFLDWLNQHGFSADTAVNEEASI